MTNQAKLEFLIEKAMKNGWEAPYPVDEDEEDAAETIYEIVMCCGHDQTYNLIFNAQFAKALFGLPEEEVFIMEPNKQTVYKGNKGWQYHLQRAVISDDPISYMYEAAK